MSHRLNPDGSAVVTVPIVVAPGGATVKLPNGSGGLALTIIPIGEPIPARTPRDRVEHLVSVGLVRLCEVGLDAASVAKAREIAGVTA